MAGMEMCSMLHAKPAAMPSRMGLVRTPLALFFSFADMLPVWAAAGLSSVRMTTAIML